MVSLDGSVLVLVVLDVFLSSCWLVLLAGGCLAWRDLPAQTAPAQYSVTNEAGDTRLIWVSKNKRRIVDALIDSPIHCASPCRLSHFVMGLKQAINDNFWLFWRQTHFSDVWGGVCFVQIPAKMLSRDANAEFLSVER